MVRAKTVAQTANAKKSAKAMQKAFANEPWTDIYIPLDDADDSQENHGYNYVEATINGNTYLIQKGVNVSVPVPIYVVMRQSGRFKVQ